MSKENLEKLKEEFKKQINELDKKIKEKEEEENKGSTPVYKNYYIKRNLSKKEDEDT